MKSGNYCSKGVQKVARTLQDLLTISTPQIRVGKSHHGYVAKRRVKEPFTGAVEVVILGLDKS